jgi:hypothetical protein
MINNLLQRSCRTINWSNFFLNPHFFTRKCRWVKTGGINNAQKCAFDKVLRNGHAAFRLDAN